MPQSGQVVGVVPGQLTGDRVEAGQVSLVGVGLAEPKQTRVGVQLDDRPKRERLVDAHHVEQGRVLERDRRDGDPGDRAAAHRAGLTARIGTLRSSSSC